MAVSIIKSVTMLVFPNTLIQIDSIDLRFWNLFFTKVKSKIYTHKNKALYKSWYSVW